MSTARRAGGHSGGGHSPSGESVNVTPLIDVVMVLIIFYLIVGRLAMDRSAPVALPRAGTGVVEQAQRPLLVTVALARDPAPGAPVDAADARLILRDRFMTPEELTAALSAEREADPALIVQVRADRRLPFGAVAPVLDAARSAGLSSVRLVTERAPESAVGSR